MKIKTSELTGAALDWAVAKCEGKNSDWEIHAGNILYGRATTGFINYKPSTDWSQGGPIIERERISVISDAREIEGESWMAENYDGFCMRFGQTTLIAAMRCYVASKLGDEVEIPEGFK